MITLSELYPIGYVTKTHGIKGELNVRLDTDFNPEDFRFAVFDMDSIFVPFEIDYSRGKGDDIRLVRLEGVDSVEEARSFVAKTFYVLLRELKEHPGYDDASADEQGLYLSDLVGYDLFDENGERVGEIVGYNDDTQNYLLEVKLPDGRKIYIPYVDEWLVDLNQDENRIAFTLPNGIID